MEQKKLRFKSREENLALVDKLLDEVCATYMISEDYYGNIYISVVEAARNAVIHGNKCDENKFVEVVFEKVSLDTITFTIRDQGLGFDPDSIPDPTAPENIEKENGRGVFIIRQLADIVKFNDKGREVVLFFNIGKN
jgi:serine/threonine-protein kinase RsbW